MLLCERGLRLRTRCNKSSFIHTFSPLLLLTLSTFLPRSLTLLVARNGLRRLVSSYLQCSPFFSFLFFFSSSFWLHFSCRAMPCSSYLTSTLQTAYYRALHPSYPRRITRTDPVPPLHCFSYILRTYHTHNQNYPHISFTTPPALSYLLIAREILPIVRGSLPGHV